MIYVAPEYKDVFSGFGSVDDFLRIEMDVVRRFKHRTTGRFEIGGQGFYIKKHLPCGLGMVLDELGHLRKPHIGAGHERRILDTLGRLGIDSMKVAAFGEEGGLPHRQKSFLVTEELTRVESLEPLCAGWNATPPPAAFRHALTRKLAEISRQMHAHGINHRDFYLCHFLLDMSSGPEIFRKTPRLFLIDLHRAQQRRKVPFRWRVKDVGGLYFSALDIGLTRSDAARFMRIYADKPLRQTLNEDGRFWKAVWRRAVRTYRRQFGKNPAATFQAVGGPC